MLEPNSSTPRTLSVCAFQTAIARKVLVEANVTLPWLSAEYSLSLSPEIFIAVMLAV
jgi:hypothetical protein